MPDLERRFRTLHGVHAPELWTEITDRASRPAVSGPAAHPAVAFGAVAAMVTLVVVLVSLIGAPAVREGMNAPPVPESSPQRAAGTDDGALRAGDCTFALIDSHGEELEPPYVAEMTERLIVPELAASLTIAASGWVEPVIAITRPDGTAWPAGSWDADAFTNRHAGLSFWEPGVYRIELSDDAAGCALAFEIEVVE